MSEDIKKFLEDFDNRKKYTSLDEETLNSIKDLDLEQAILDHVYFKFEDDFRREYEVVTSLSNGIQAVYATIRAEGEINNGGFLQFFWNAAGQFAIEAIDGFYEIGAPKAGNLMKRAVAIAIEEYPEMRKFQEQRTLEAFSESYKHTVLNDLDHEFWNLDERLSVLRIKYIREHPELFDGD